MSFRLKTLGHATMLVLEDGQPLLATDPWLIGSAYWRSWWLERYPSRDEIDLVRQAKEVYITHSHPDHFHWPSLRQLGPRSTIHPTFPRNTVPEFLRNNGYGATLMDPWRWYPLGERARMASIPNLLDDSIIVVDTPSATIVNLNDAAPRDALLKSLRERLLTPGKRVVVLRSYSPASTAVSMFVDNRRVPLKSKRDYALTARGMAEALGAKDFVPFASQAFFNRTDSRWANEYKVTLSDLREHWGDGPVRLCEPMIDFDLETGAYSSQYDAYPALDPIAQEKVRLREQAELAFSLPHDFDINLKKYMDELSMLGVFFRRGIGWKLTSGAERFYNTRTKQLEPHIPTNYDVIVSLPDMVLDEALRNNMLTDLGISMFIRVDTKVGLRQTYGLFLMMGVHDYGYLGSIKNTLRCARFYAPAIVPMVLSDMRKKLRPQQSHAS